MAAPETDSGLKAQFKLRHWLAVIVLLLFTITGPLLYWARFQSYSICFDCAQIRDSIAWEIPFVHRKLFETVETNSTRLAEIIETNELVGQHEHDWKFVFGSGNGSPMVFGISQSISSAMISTGTGNFLEALIRHGEPQEAREWLAGLRDAKQAEWSRCIAERLGGRTFATAEDFRSWVALTEEENRHFLNH